jgi:hypothetical protein
MRNSETEGGRKLYCEDHPNLLSAPDIIRVISQVGLGWWGL